MATSATAPPAPVPAAEATANPMATHVKVIGILDLVLAALAGLMALAMIVGMGIGRMAVDDSERYGTPTWVADMMSSLAIVLGVAAALVGALYALAGFRLLAFKASGKPLGIAAAVLQLVFGLPMIMAGGLGLLGLAAAIYALVILTRPDTDRLLVNP